MDSAISYKQFIKKLDVEGRNIVGYTANKVTKNNGDIMKQRNNLFQKNEDIDRNISDKVSKNIEQTIGHMNQSSSCLSLEKKLDLDLER